MEVAFNADAVDRSINIDLADTGGTIPQIKSDLTSQSSYDFQIDYKIDGQDTQNTHYADIGMSRKIPMAFLGGGMSRLLSIILAIATAKNGIVLIDEVDAGIHYSHMPKVWEGISRAAREFNCQIFASTHSYECLQAAYNGIAQADMAREFRYIRLERDKQETVAKTYTHDLLGAALSRGWEIR